MLAFTKTLVIIIRKINHNIIFFEIVKSMALKLREDKLRSGDLVSDAEGVFFNHDLGIYPLPSIIGVYRSNLQRTTVQNDIFAGVWIAFF